MKLLVAFCSLWVLSEAWVPLAPASSRVLSTTRRSVTVEPGLTAQDEEILFGGTPPDTNIRRKDHHGNTMPALQQPPNPLDHSDTNPLINKLHTMRQSLTSCPQLWEELEQIMPDERALFDEHLCDTKIDWTFAQMNHKVSQAARLFADWNTKSQPHIPIFGENSAHWLVVDHAIQRAGGVSAVRGADAPLDELRYIYEHADAAGMVVLQGPKLLQQLAKSASRDGPPLGLSNEAHGPVRRVVLMHKEKKTSEEIQQMGQELGVEIVVLGDVLETMEPLDELPTVTRDQVATIVYTSGTTGRPKGVMLTHGNLLHQTGHRLSYHKPFEESEPLPGELMVSILPVWHITERSFELWVLSRGCHVVYSSIRTLRNDLAKHRPQWAVLVPRVLEKIAAGVQDKFNSGSPAVKTLAKVFTAASTTAATHRKIVDGLVVADEAPGPLEKAASRAILKSLAPVNALGKKLVWSKVLDGFGGRLKAVLCGGSALSGSLETFYEAAGLKICVAFGLTECSPVITHRRIDANLVTAGCVGRECADTEFRVVDPDLKPDDEPRPPLPNGQIGLVIARGPQIMKGYYKNPTATAQAVDPWGFFDTGDLGRVNPVTGDLILTGRAKDTIVLSNGENIEPQPIEDAILGASPWIDQIMLQGDDGRRLVGIVVLNPKELATAGYLTKDVSQVVEAFEALNDPKCSVEDCEKYTPTLRQASEELRSNRELQEALAQLSKSATKDFRKWEQVSSLYVTVEPFAMVNGLLTQSYKVKRNVVSERYASLG